VISKAVFVVENAIIDKEMYSHKLSAMADNYPADWCINPEKESIAHFSAFLANCLGVSQIPEGQKM